MMKDIIVTALYNLGYVLIFPGFLFCFFAGLLLCGIDRKLVAKMQKRVGPPVLQPFYDFFKLCGKECIVPAAASRTMFLMAPLVGLAALVVIQLFIPVFTFTAFSQVADIIVILYLLLIPAMSAMLGGAASGSPYAGVGLSREMVTIISCELPLVLVLLSVAKTVGDAMGTGLCFSLTDIALYQAANGSLILKASMIPAAAARPATTPLTRPRPRRRYARACLPNTAARRLAYISSITPSRCSRLQACLSRCFSAASAAG